MRRRTLDITRPELPPGSLLGADHPLARAIDHCQSTKRQCAVVAAIMLGCLRPTVEGHQWATALTVAATAVLAGLVLLLVARYRAISDHAVELIAEGQDTLAVEAVRRQCRRLQTVRTRASLARCLDRMVTRSRASHSRQLCPAPELFDYRLIRSVSSDLHAIAELLRAGHGRAPGLARLDRLVTHAGSPLYGREPRRLRAELETVRGLLTTDD